MKVSIDCNQFWDLVNTGADLLLISDKFLHLFEIKVIRCKIILTGITNVTIEATKKLHTTQTIQCFPSKLRISVDFLNGHNIFEDQRLISI